MAPDGSSNQYSYDALNRLQTLTNSLTGQFGFGGACPERSRRNALSRRTQLTRPNGINTNYGYDAVSRLLSVLHQSGSTTLDGASYTYDYAGNRISNTNYLNGITSNYGYDLIYELQQVTQGGSTTESYSYDPVGNRLSSLGVPSYSYNSSNELTSNSNGSYTYDANGNTLADAQGRSFTWDFENRLTQVVNPGVGTTTFRYDPFGRRIQKSGPLGTTNYLYDGDDLLETATAAGALIARFTSGRNIDELLAIQGSSSIDYYDTDAQGSVTSLTAPDASMVQNYTYGSFGNTTNSSGSLSNSFRYQAREIDTETNLYYFRARYYDPITGRFVSEDPCRSEVGTSWYQYADNNSPNFGDWSGCKGNKLPPPNLPPGTSKHLLNLFHDGWDDMLNRLNNKNCHKFFCDHGFSPQRVLQTLQGTHYGFQSLGNPDTGAATTPYGSVVINTDGLFVTADSGTVTLGKMRCRLGNDSDVRGMILLHELGHQLGIFGEDAGPDLAPQNTAHSLDIINHCFPGACLLK